MTGMEPTTAKNGERDWGLIVVVFHLILHCWLSNEQGQLLYRPQQAMSAHSSLIYRDRIHLGLPNRILSLSAAKRLRLSSTLIQSSLLRLNTVVVRRKGVSENS